MSKRNDWSVKNLKFCHRTRLRSDIERTVIKNAQRPVKVVTMIATSGSETSVLVCEWVVQVCGFEWIKHVFVCTSIGKSLSLCKHKGLGIGNNSFELRVSRSKGGWVRRLPWRWRIEQIHRRPTIHGLFTSCVAEAKTDTRDQWRRSDFDFCDTEVKQFLRGVMYEQCSRKNAKYENWIL